MNWTQLLSANRKASTSGKQDIRSQFQRDYDRIIFSSPFRRLQNKTQVFPLPGSVFVHNRLTHSLEVASVGRSIANSVSKVLLDKKETDLRNTDLFNELGSIVSAACWRWALDFSLLSRIDWGSLLKPCVPPANGEWACRSTTNSKRNNISCYQNSLRSE